MHCNVQPFYILDASTHASLEFKCACAWALPAGSGHEVHVLQWHDVRDVQEGPVVIPAAAGHR